MLQAQSLGRTADSRCIQFINSPQMPKGLQTDGIFLFARSAPIDLHNSHPAQIGGSHPYGMHNWTVGPR
jgi:hypothetical protein